MDIKLWGVRGSLPTPMGSGEYESRIIKSLDEARSKWSTQADLSSEEIFRSLPVSLRKIIGGESTCVEVTEGEHRLIIDMGTGARKLGYRLAMEKFSGDMHILMTHTHWDHIQGWPFFAPAYNPINNIRFYSALWDCEERFQVQQRFEFFPISLGYMASKKEFITFNPGDSFDIGPFHITTAELIHLGICVAYKIAVGNKVFVMSTDTEFVGERLQAKIEDYKEFYLGADLVLLDGQYSEEEASSKVGWGHTSTRAAVECGLAWQVKRLAITHHEPAHLDTPIFDLYHDTVKYLKERAPDSALELHLAIEGETYTI
jgi:phosphoribosyl 1,2-cyclic phosphodiesterase